jgi:glycyl-tRNA synthetase
MEAARTNTDGFDAQDQIEGNPNMGSLWGVPSLLVVPMALAWLYKRWAAMRQPQGAQHFFSPDAHCTVNVSALESPAVSMATVTGERTQQYVLSMDDLVSLCKRRGFVYQASDLYGGFAGFWDYGPLGVELKNQIKAKWWKKMVQLRDDVVGIDSAIIGSPKVWEASGHLAGFSDPMVDCKESNQRFRADQVLYSAVLDAEGKQCGYVSCQQDEVSNEKALAKKAKKLVKEAGGKGPHQPLNFKELIDCPVELIDQIPSPATGNPGTLTPPRDFNLMFSTNVGPVVADSSTAFLRPETAQGIFTNFKNVMDTSRVSLPFGIAQIGKAFRNEITPRNFIFRSREFEQMEIEYFIKEDDWERCHQEWLDTMHKFLMETCGLRPELVGTEVHAQDKLAHYARACTDLTFHFPFGEQELLGVAARGCYDLTQHANASGRKLEVNDQQTKTKFIPHVIEPSLGVDRLFLAVLCSAYDEDEIGGEKRTVLRFSPEIAPVKVLVLPLVKNNEDIMGRAKDLFERLRMRWNCTMDITGAIGRRYRRGDEAGVPFCVTVDFDSLEDGTVTVRDRDSTEQKRVSEDELIAELTKAIDGY